VMPQIALRAMAMPRVVMPQIVLHGLRGIPIGHRAHRGVAKALWM